MKNNPLPRLDEESDIREKLLPHCRLKVGDVWHDPKGRHRVACIDATDNSSVKSLADGHSSTLAIHDPPYNLVAFELRSVAEFTEWCSRWVKNTFEVMGADAAFYVWLGADQNDHFQPLPQFMTMMAELNLFESRSYITMRNQRGYGTQKNWMAVRQELLYYTKGNPRFEVHYTDIPKILKGYYKEVGGRKTENSERSKSDTIRPGNVWVDIQQVFYRMEENVSGCFAQKPLKAIERIVRASSAVDEIVLDFFGHSGTTLMACERLDRRCFTAEIDPIFCEIAIRRIEHFRQTGRIGWQNSHPFEDILGETPLEKEETSSTEAKVARNGRLF